jgi:hypothetical protein
VCPVLSCCRVRHGPVPHGYQWLRTQSPSATCWLLPWLQVTPFLLERIRALTGGKSLHSNIQLVKNNAAVGARIAVDLATIRSAASR